MTSYSSGAGKYLLDDAYAYFQLQLSRKGTTDTHCHYNKTTIRYGDLRIKTQRFEPPYKIKNDHDILCVNTSPVVPEAYGLMKMRDIWNWYEWIIKDCFYPGPRLIGTKLQMNWL